MIDHRIKDNTVINGVSYFFSLFFRPLLGKLRIQLSNLSEMMSYRANKNQSVPLFSRLLIVARLFIVCTCK